MSKFGIDPYAAIGLTENPFLVHALKPDASGKRLLVGRDEQIRLVAQRLHKHGKITCLDGHVGVGKTSLVNVAAYECYEAFLAGETSQLLIPSTVSFQLKKDESADQFCSDVFQGVAQTLLSHREQLQERINLINNGNQIHAWLNSPIVEHLNANGGASLSFGAPGIASVSVKGGLQTNGQINQSTGFARSGFESLVRDWLNQIFSVQGSGGVVCVIDNIELLETGTNARRTLETLRDRLFNVNGLRWVFCGANGVIHSLAASPRLTAFLSTPVIEVANVAPSAIEPLIKARLNEFSTDPTRAEHELPIQIEDLKYLYRLVNSNLRDLLGLADEYCEYAGQLGKPLREKDQKKKRFEKWLERATTERYHALSSRISEKAWAVLDIAMSDQFKGTFGAGDYTTFNQSSTTGFEKSTFARWLRDLVKLGLITKTLDDEPGNDDDGFTRDVFTVTAKGALVHYARRQKSESFSIGSSDWLRRVHF